jgi:hypothetical protein
MKLTNKEKILGEIYADQVKELEEKIEAAFKAKEYTVSDDHIEIIVTGEYREPVKQMVIENYMCEDWGEVTIKGSSENGERGGLSRVTLYYDENYAR